MTTGSTGQGPPAFLVGGRYRLGPQIGRGGMGAVYAAVDSKTERAVALKLLLEADEKALARFRREARAAASLRHPHIVGVLDFDIDDPNGPYIVMEKVDGVSLHTLIETERRLVPARAVAIATQLLSALAHAHAAGILHRDVKPGNILVTTTPGAPDFVRLVDFGLAKHSDPAQGGPAITTMASMLGTPAYMPPEQMTGDVLDARADIYSAGLVLYRMLAGVDAYPLTGTERMLAVMARKPGRPLLSVAPVDPELAQLVDQCIAPERAMRPPSASEVIDRLARFSAPIAAAPSSNPALTSAQIASGIPTVGAPSPGYGAATLRPASENYAPTAFGPAPLALTVHDSRSSMPASMRPSLPPQSMSAVPPYAAAAPPGASRNGLVLVVAILGGVLVVGALALGGFFVLTHRGDATPGGAPSDGGAPTSPSVAAASSSSAAPATGATTSPSSRGSPRGGASTPSRAAPVASVPPASPAQASTGAPAASATAPSCFCNSTKGSGLCTTPQESACSCGAQLCSSPITDTGTCASGRSFNGFGKKFGDPCTGFAPGPTVNGKVTSVMQQAVLTCNMCPRVTRGPAVPGAPCTGFGPSGATESGTFVCSR